MQLAIIHAAEVDRLDAAINGATHAARAALNSLDAARATYEQARATYDALSGDLRRVVHERAKEDIQHLLRQEVSRALYGVSDAPYYSRLASVLDEQYIESVYQHALAVAGNLPTTGAGGSIAEALKFFDGQGFSLPVNVWYRLRNEARGINDQSTDTRVISCVQWMQGGY